MPERASGVATYHDLIRSRPRQGFTIPAPDSGRVAVWLARQAGSAGDPSLRLKNGSVQDDVGI